MYIIQYSGQTFYIFCFSVVEGMATDCSSRNFDLVFIVDSSGSICRDDNARPCNNWNFMTNFLISIVESFNIGPTNTQVGLVEFGNVGLSQFFLKNYTTKEDVIAAISALPYLDERTNTAGGIRVAMKEQFIEENGDRGDFENVAILIIDGETSIDITRTIPDAVALRDHGVNVFAIGVTNNVNEEEVMQISSEPQRENETYWLVTDFDVLQDVVITIVEETCQIVSNGE